MKARSHNDLACFYNLRIISSRIIINMKRYNRTYHLNQKKIKKICICPRKRIRHIVFYSSGWEKSYGGAYWNHVISKKREKNGNCLKVWEGREIKEKRKMVLSSKIKKKWSALFLFFGKIWISKKFIKSRWFQPKFDKT